MMQDLDNNIEAQLKYSPKYCTKVIYQKSDLLNHKLLLKIKSVKLIKEIQMPDYSTPNIRNRVKNTFQAQRKTMRQTNITDPKILEYFTHTSSSI